MKRLIKTLLLSIGSAIFLLSMGPVAQASTVTGNFNVTVTLPSACTVTAPANVAFTYTSFQGAVANSTGGGFLLSCTNTLPYALSLDVSTNTVIGLVYALTLPANGNGTGAGQALTITGTMAAGQGGTCAVASCPGTQARVLTVTY